jgi:DNA-binding beta-propeller fold protein YncE
MRNLFGAAALAAAMSFTAAAQAQFLIIGNDEKVAFDDNGKQVLSPAGKDTVSIVDISNRSKPRLVTSLQLENSIAGPPTNVAITPDNKLALVANSLDVIKDGDSLKAVPDNKVYVIDLTASPPAMIATVQTGKQPSGMAINKAGNLALVANRADNSVSVLSISGKNVSVVGTVALAPPDTPSQHVSGIAISPDGKRALAFKAMANKVSLLEINGTTVTYKGYDMITGVFPYNAQFTSDGKLAIINNNGAAGSADGQIDTVAVIDMTLDPPRVTDQIAVGDAPEGLGVSPTAGYAISLLTNGAGNVPKNAFFHHDHAVAVLLKSDGKTVRKVGQTEVGTLSEGVAFSPDGSYVYIANWGEQNVVPYRITGDKLVEAGTPLKLPGHPVSMRSSTP